MQTDGSPIPRKPLPIPAIAALLSGTAAFLYSLGVRTGGNAIAWSGIFYPAGLVVLSALLVRHAGNPRETTFRAAATALIVVFALTPALDAAQILITALRRAESASSYSPLLSHTVIMEAMNGLLNPEAWYPAMAALGILIMMNRRGAARVVAVVAMVLAVQSHLLAPLAGMLYGASSGGPSAAVLTVMAFPAELMILVVLGVMPAPKNTPLPGDNHE